MENKELGAPSARTAIDLIVAAETRARKLEDALRQCVLIVDKAGLNNLANGVQLGPVSWFVKASDAFDCARRVLGDRLEEVSAASASKTHPEAVDSKALNARAAAQGEEK